RPRRVGDLHERELRNGERRHLDVHQQGGIAVVRRRTHLDARPRLVRGRGDPHLPGTVNSAERHRIDVEAIQPILRNQAGIERLRYLAWERVDLLDGAERAFDACVHTPYRVSSGLSGIAAPEWPSIDARCSRASAISSGVFTFMKTRSGGRKRATSSSAMVRTRTVAKKQAILRRPARNIDSIGPRQLFA